MPSRKRMGGNQPPENSEKLAGLNTKSSGVPQPAASCHEPSWCKDYREAKKRLEESKQNLLRGRTLAQIIRDEHWLHNRSICHRQ